LQNELTNLANQYSAKLSSLTVPDAEAQQKWAAIPLPLGYIAPDMEDKYIRSISSCIPSSWLVDKTAVELENFVTGANESGYHGRCQLGEQFPDGAVGRRTKAQRAIALSTQPNPANRQRHRGGTHFPAGD